MHKAAATVFVFSAFMLPVMALAQTTSTPRIDRREANQERRIDQGVRSGALNSREANRLDRGEQHIDNIENRAKSDGVVTHGERARINAAENRESRRIYRQKHDAQTAR